MTGESIFRNFYRISLTIGIAILVVVLSACASDSGAALSSEEESGTEFGLNETYDVVRNGAHLILNYDEQSNSFIGFVENTKDKPLEQVRVEVHLSNGVELGPTTLVDLNPGARITVILKATNTDFRSWGAHPEVGGSGNGEHGHGEGDNEHGAGGEKGHDEGGSE